MRIGYLIILQCLVCSLTYSQVTIGSGIVPNKGALLDLKEKNTINGVNSTKGLMLPRVSLNNKNSLEDISDVNFADINEQIAHTGLIVYNTNPAFEEGVGLQLWDGNEWTSIKSDTIRTTSDKIIYTERTYFMGMTNSDVSILDLSLLPIPNGWTILSYSNAFINAGNSYNIGTGIFKVKNTGIYNIFARYQTAGLNLLGRLGLGILIKRATDQDQTFKPLVEDTYTALLATGESREVSSNDIELNIGDEIAFAIVKANLLTLTIASSNASYAVIRQK